MGDIIILLIILTTSIWVLIDAKNLGVKKGLIKGIGNMGPWGWFIVCLLIWIIAFPIYLFKRSEYKRLARLGTSNNNNVTAKVCAKCGTNTIPNQKFCGSCGAPV